ncbi:FadR family transcriptional regulator [Paenibacillus hemerocallicola]|jgi:GntR family L-lactate dehydrogenase operon transcriptional regulator|uniref:FadR family transcriptional regulator n=1 Tax=Paenibacillus hemerocallicola TaxID=1172614 RepID=A0A5C4T6T2_9BACL|nr:FCD domain-containing protein [Paenibacillus hemerocallicola]TNJ64047.1 FadR family transcriptional regulator [Paenibacillus hemerocallicola]
MQEVNMKQLRNDCELLSMLDTSPTPVGATTLVLILGEQLGMSQASIGRKLMEFDLQGFTRLQGRKGRVLTIAGKRHMEELQRKLSLRDRNMNFLEALNSSEEKNLLDVLISRRALERENAYLAAIHATSEELASLHEIIHSQRESLDNGTIPNREDEKFHMTIAQMSRNKVLYHALRLVWDEGMNPHVTGKIRHSLGKNLVVEHVHIYECIAAGDPEAASEAMLQHINGIIDDVKTFFALKGSVAALPKLQSVD